MFPDLWPTLRVSDEKHASSITLTAATFVVSQGYSRGYLEIGSLVYPRIQLPIPEWGSIRVPHNIYAPIWFWEIITPKEKCTLALMRSAMTCIQELYGIPSTKLVPQEYSVRDISSSHHKMRGDWYTFLERYSVPRRIPHIFMVSLEMCLYVILCTYHLHTKIRIFNKSLSKTLQIILSCSSLWIKFSVRVRTSKLLHTLKHPSSTHNFRHRVYDFNWKIHALYQLSLSSAGFNLSWIVSVRFLEVHIEDTQSYPWIAIFQVISASEKQVQAQTNSFSIPKIIHLQQIDDLICSESTLCWSSIF